MFPKQSAHAVPECYRKLYEPTSEIIDFYPTEVKLDVNGARYAWMGVNLLPFLDRERLKAAMTGADEDEALLKPNEQTRNKRTGDIRLFFVKSGKEEGELQKSVLTLAEGSVLDASFERGDTIAGPVYNAG